MIDETLLKRIKKLLALSTSSNEHEAAAAAAKAQALMFEHNLEMAQVEGVDLLPDATKVGEEYQYLNHKPGMGTEWQRDLANSVAVSGFCQLLYQGRRIIWIGRKADIEMAQYTFSFLSAELVRLRDEYGKRVWDEAKAEAKAHGLTFHEWERNARYEGRHPLTAKNEWIHGAVSGVSTTLMQEFRERSKATEQSTALVAVRGAEVKEWINEKYPKLGTRRSNGAGWSEHYVAGQATGRTMGVRPGLGGSAKGAIR